MALVPTVKMKKETAVITVNADQVEAWEAHGYKVLDAQAPAKDGDKSTDVTEGDQAPSKPKGKKAPAKDGDK